MQTPTSEAPSKTTTPKYAISYLTSVGRALAILTKGTDITDDIAARFNEYCEEAQSDAELADLYCDLAFLSYVKGDYEAASTYFDIAERYHPTITTQAQIIQSVCYLELAKSINEKKVSPKARILTEKALEKLADAKDQLTKKKDMIGLAQIGDIYKEYDQVSLAKACYHSAATFTPNNKAEEVAYIKAIQGIGNAKKIQSYYKDLLESGRFEIKDTYKAILRKTTESKRRSERAIKETKSGKLLNSEANPVRCENESLPQNSNSKSSRNPSKEPNNKQENKSPKSPKNANSLEKFGSPKIGKNLNGFFEKNSQQTDKSNDKEAEKPVVSKPDEQPKKEKKKAKPAKFRPHIA